MPRHRRPDYLMSDECPCPQCQEGESPKASSLLAWATGSIAFQYLGRRSHDIPRSCDVDLSESRVVAMLDEDGGWKEPSKEHGNAKLVRRFPRDETTQRGDPVWIASREPTLNGQPLPSAMRAHLEYLSRETNAAIDDLFAGRVPMLPLTPCDDDEPSMSPSLRDRQAHE